MPINMEERLKEEDLFIDYNFEEVMFCRDHRTGLIFKKFYSEDEGPQPVPPDNRLYLDAIRFGDKTTEQMYIKGRSRK